MTQFRSVAAKAPSRPVFRHGSDDLAQVRILLHSDDRSVREQVTQAIGTHLSARGPVIEWHEVATPEAVISAVEAGGFDLLILDGEADKNGGMGLCRQLKNEIYRCPDVLVLIGREVDAWLASWSLADGVVARPLDPRRLQAEISRLVGTAS